MKPHLSDRNRCPDCGAPQFMLTSWPDDEAWACGNPNCPPKRERAAFARGAVAGALTVVLLLLWYCR